MSEHLRRIFSIIMIFTLVLGSFFVLEPIKADAGIMPAAGVVSISNLSASNYSPSLGDTVRLSFDYTSSMDFVRIDAYIQFGTAGEVQGSTIRDGNSAWTEFTIDSYGEWKINYLLFTDANNNQYCLYNTTATSYIPPGGTGMDMSAVNLTVNQAVADTEKPVIDVSTLKIDNKSHFVGDWAEATVKITDNDGISNVGIMYQTGNGQEVSGGAIHVGNDNWKVQIQVDVPGEYKILYITATDYSGNSTAVYTLGYSGYKPAVGETKSLAAATFKATGSNPNDKKAPIIHTNTLSVSKIKADLNEKVVVSVKITEESKLERINPFVQMGKAGICEMSNAFQYNSATGKYEMTLDSEYYGIWEIMGIHAVDANGNETLIYNSNMYTGETPYGYFGNPTAKKDMSGSVFYVGITDADTGIFITGNGMNNNVRFDAKHLSKDGNAYKKLYKEGYNVDKFMELKVSGNYSERGEKVKVEFPVSASNGSKVLIKHLRPNGQIQQEAKTVYGGKVSMYVSDFSPFMILSTDNGELLAGDEDMLNDTKEDKDAAKKEKEADNAEKKDGKKDGVLDNLFNKSNDESGGPNIGVIIGIGLLVIAAGGGGAYYYYKKRK